MSRLEQLLAGILVLIALAVAGWLGVLHYGAQQYRAGKDAAIAAGDKLRQAEADRNQKTESDLRAQLAARDADAFTKEQTYAANLDAAQRRVRAGADRLRCPASPIPAGAASGDRPAAGGPVADGAGPDLVPEAASDILGYGAAVAGLVRRYERLQQRFEACRAVNSQP
jgi:hypothetical protein